MSNDREVFNKRIPGNGKTFIPIPSDLTHYTQHPDYMSDMTHLYALIIDYYNVDIGYAYPSLTTLELHYGKSINTVVKHLKILENLGLIDNVGKGRYIPLVPLSKNDFYEAYPIAWRNYKRRYSYIEERKSKERVRAREWRSGNV